MKEFPINAALIFGAGPGISASVARLLAKQGVKVGLVARNVDKLVSLRDEIGAITYAADVSEVGQVASVFEAAEKELGNVDAVIYNAGARVRGSLLDLDPAAVENALKISAMGGFYVAQQAARRMVPRGRGAIFITGATASTSGFPNSAPFAMGKFALRGLAQSAAKELGPKGIHVAHFIIDGSVRSEQRPVQDDKPDALLNPDDIAQTYIDTLFQRRSAWSFEIDLRPWVEKF